METNLSYGAVTFLDVLGWKGIWQKKPDSINTLLDIIDSAKICIEDIRKEHKDQNGEFTYLDNIDVEVISISDTIVLLTIGSTEATLELHARMCTKIVASALA